MKIETIEYAPLRHSRNYQMVEGEKNTEPSKTVPNMAMSIQEIMHRHLTGRPLSFANNLHYTGEEYYPDVREMDLVDIEAAAKASQERIERLEKELEQKTKLRTEARLEFVNRLKNKLYEKDDKDIIQNNNISESDEGTKEQ